MEYKIENLKNYKLLNTLSLDYLSHCLKNNNNNFKKLSYTKGEIIHIEGDECKNIEIILRGHVIIERIDFSGNLMTVAEFYADEILGGNLIFSKNPYYPMTVTAKTNVSIIAISKSLIFELCSENKEFLKVFLEHISDNTLVLGNKIKHYVNRSIRESLISFLKAEYKIQNTNRILLKISKKALAEKIGVQRTSISRELQKMKNDGLIEFDKNSITVIDESILL